jgi:nucleotide-binding universal stress UspA family protein
MTFAKQRRAAQFERLHPVCMKKLNIQNIVVPIDFSKVSTQAIETAKHLARRFTASIHLAHVRQLNYAADFVAPAPPVIPFSFMTYEQDAERAAIKELKKVASERGVSSATCNVLSGAPPFDEICQLAHTIPADLVVMPTHGRTGLKHIFLGSTAERIVQHSSCPVLVTRGNALQTNNGSPFRVKTILVPVDFSKCSREGLRYAIAFANEFGGRIILQHATYLGYVYSCEGTAIYDIPALQTAAREIAGLKMRELVRSVNFGAVKFETAFTEGSPVVDICAFAKDHDVDLIIISTHGLTGFKHILIGSIAEQVVRHAPCSVLVVPSHPRLRAANLAKSAGATVNRLASQRQSANVLKIKAGQKIPSPQRMQRRKTNKFRESQCNR